MRILTVCLGNICRSPLAEGIIRQRFLEAKIPLNIDSCGIASYHNGEKADIRSITTAKLHGIDISMHRARKFSEKDFDDFDLILTTDLDNHQHIIRMARNETERQKVKMIMDIVYPDMQMEVPDPYYGGNDGFENIFSMLDLAAQALVDQVRKKKMNDSGKS